MSGSSTIREIKARISIVDLVRRYVELKQAGNRWVAPCPFHQETKPSFSVNEEEGFFYCFGCQAAGDIFDFYSRINGLEFRECLEQLAQEAGVQLGGSYKPDPKAAEKRSFKKIALKMYELATKFYINNLHSPKGKTCQKYINNRRLSLDIIKKFELGWSLPEWRGLSDSLQRAGYKENDAVEAGLSGRGNRGTVYDRFRGRLIFPIKNLSGQVIAFGGRIIEDEDAAKYINSSDSVLYKKGENLYGLFEARRAISIKKYAFLTEGYMDVITLHQFGYENSCGVLGTALTENQVRRLSGFCSEFELIFDGDGPGRKAAMNAAEMFLQKGLICRVVLLPEGGDIDDLLQGKGVEAFEDLRKYAPDGLDFCIRILSSQYAPKDTINWVKDFIEKVEQPELLSRYLSRLSQALDFDEAEIRNSLNRKGRNENTKPGLVRDKKKTDSIDRKILDFLVRYPHHLPALGNAGAIVLLTESWALSLWEKIAACAPSYHPEEILEKLEPIEKEFWGQYRVMKAPPQDTEQAELDEICSTIALRCLDKQNAACVQALHQGSSSDDADFELLKAINETLAIKRSLGSTNE